MGATPDPAFVEVVENAFRQFNERRFGEFAMNVTDDVVEFYPQSAERLQGRATQLAFHEAFPVPPTFTVRNILRDGDLAVVETDEAYPDGSVWKTVFILELRNGLIAKTTMYFGEPFDGPAWRKAYFTG
jgi:hypothetical protein